MNHEPRIDSSIERLLTEAPTWRAPDRLRADIASATSGTRQRPPWLTSLKEPPMRYRSQVVVGSPTLRLAAVVAATAALTLALAGAVIAGASPLPSSDPVPPIVQPVEVTGTLGLGQCDEPSVAVEAGVRRERGYRCDGQTWTTSDPRLTGAVTKSWNADVYRVDGAEISIKAGTYEMRNEGGGWLCQFTNSLVRGSGIITAAASDEIVSCVGNGGYEGLSALLVNDWMADPITIVGLIFAGDLPPLPEPPAA